MHYDQPEKEWDVNSVYTIESKCDRCGELKPLQRIIDPFIVEGITEGPEEYEWWCKPCFDLRQGDV